MSKKSHPRRLADSEAKASMRTIQVTPRKVNLLAGLIRGKTAQAAKAELAFSKRRAASEVLKLLDSAIANAENNHQLDVDKLYVAEASVGRAFALKRFHARARGRGARVQKLWSHLTIVVRERAEETA
jgi:large subunit ribosomal protein L22